MIVTRNSKMAQKPIDNFTTVIQKNVLFNNRLHCLKCTIKLLGKDWIDKTKNFWGGGSIKPNNIKLAFTDASKILCAQHMKLVLFPKLSDSQFQADVDVLNPCWSDRNGWKNYLEIFWFIMKVASFLFLYFARFYRYMVSIVNCLF